MKRLAACLVTLALLAGCVTLPEEKLQDRGRTRALYKGMGRAEFYRIMGSEVMQVLDTRGRVREVVQNPYETETLSRGGREFEIITYFTNPRRKDGPITQDELMPFIFEKEKLIGRGWENVRTLREEGKVPS